MKGAFMLVAYPAKNGKGISADNARVEVLF
jgi:hypothetical protein